jgi:hypothetical protein
MIDRSRVLMTCSLLAFWAVAQTLHADEGMWLYNNPPKKQLKDKYNFDATPEWMEHLQKSSARFSAGGSGSFVSPDGLVMTNHHVGSDAIQKVSTKEKNYMRDGFYAKTREEEIKCPEQEIDVLMNIEDVTERVNAAVKPGMDAAAAQKARQGVINTIEKESKDKTGLHSEVVTLYQGGQYHLYRYKRYDDVRLVFAPEQAIAFFGGDPDNFEFPRFDLDVSFFRVYENGKPAQVEHWLRWSKDGTKEGELTFVSGHPGRTDRLNTVAHLEFIRDLDMPLRLNVVRRREVALKNYSDRSLENERRARDDLFSMQNSRKARLGMLGGLQDPTLIARKKADEKALRDAVHKDPQLKEKYGDAWEQIAASLKEYKDIYKDHYVLEFGGIGAGFNSEMFAIAKRLVRLAEESGKPNAERLPEYSEAKLETLKQNLLSEAPIFEDLEIVKLGDSLSMMVEFLGVDNDVVQKVLAGKSPQQRAAELVTGSKLRDVTFRKKLLDGGMMAIETSNDPMILLVKSIDNAARKVRKTYEAKVQEPQRQGYGKIAKALFGVKGTSIYPDATFTLRLAYGPVLGYQERGETVPPYTTIGGLYKHAENHGWKDPFDPPKSWKDRKGQLKLDTPFNFVSTADIIGGNSGSPVVNTKGELVGIIFDGNIQSLVLDYAYTDEVARAVSVDSRAIIEALRKVYDAGKLAEELMGKGTNR